MLSPKYSVKLFICLSFTFFVATIVGTLSHEFGHYAVAKHLGYTTNISYGYTNWVDTTTSSFIDSVYTKYNKQIILNEGFPNKVKFEQIEAKLQTDDFKIALGGPIQTMLTGTIGFILLLQQKMKILTTTRINFYQWCCIFLSLFWLRQLANLVTWVVGYFINGSFALNADEISIALSIKLPKATLLTITAAVGLAILTFIIFKIIPNQIRFTFILAGLLGGIFGYFFWLVWVGPLLMP